MNRRKALFFILLPLPILAMQFGMMLKPDQPKKVPPLDPVLKIGADLNALERRVNALESRFKREDERNAELLADFQADLDRAGIPKLPVVKED